MTRTKIYFSLSLLLLLLFLASCSNIESDSKNKRGCSSVDGCLSKYDFENARYHYSAHVKEWGGDYKGYLKKITIAESKYWADQGDIDRALSVIDESWGVSESDWPEEDWQCWKFNIIDKGVSSCCEKGNYKQAKILALKAADDINVDGIKIGSGTGRFLDKAGIEFDYRRDSGCKEIKAKGPSMRESLLKKISQFEELLKQ
jgi:hypothetical protein